MGQGRGGELRSGMRWVETHLERGLIIATSGCMPQVRSASEMLQILMKGGMLPNIFAN